ncbi:MAG: hypothetical protein N2440_05265 [Actinobacteria bacterium]|nr:hypothetical protein [Actinomycetota bacterium]
MSQKEKTNVLLLVSPDKELLEVRARRVVDNQKKLGIRPLILSYKEVGIDDALLETSQGVLFGGNEFLWYRDISEVSDSEFKKLYETIKNLIHRNVLLTVHENRKSLTRWKGFESLSHVKLVIYDDKDISLYEKLLLTHAKSSGYKISLKAVHSLIDRCGGNISLAYNELEKLMLYRAQEKIILEKDVIDFVSGVSEVKAFDFINSILSKTFDRAINQFLDITSGGEKPEALFYLLLQQFTNFVTVAIDYKSGVSIQDIEKETGLKAWQITKKFIPFSEKWSPQELVNAYWYLLTLDSKIKKGALRDYSLAVKLFLLKMLSKQPVS